MANKRHERISPAQKQKRCFDRSKQRFCIPYGPPKCSKRLATLACTRSNRRILYPEVILRGIRLRSAHKLNESKLFVPEGTVPLGLFLVAFPPPPVTFPATRLSS